MSAGRTTQDNGPSAAPAFVSKQSQAEAATVPQKRAPAKPDRTGCRYKGSPSPRARWSAGERARIRSRWSRDTHTGRRRREYGRDARRARFSPGHGGTAPVLRGTAPGRFARRRRSGSGSPQITTRRFRDRGGLPPCSLRRNGVLPALRAFLSGWASCRFSRGRSFPAAPCARRAGDQAPSRRTLCASARAGRR